MSGRTRIPFDIVDSLGEFIELEVVLSDSEGSVPGEREAQGLMDRLEGVLNYSSQITAATKCSSEL